MDGWPTEPDKQRNSPGRMNIKIDCLQINFRHSKTATYNLQKIIDEEGTDILCIQEPYTIGSKVMGIPRSYTVFATRAGRKRAAIIIKNKLIDAILLNQLSDDDVVVVEIGVEGATLIIVTMYFNINRPIDIDLQKIQTILTRVKGVGIIFAIESNARSTPWHDVLTNNRGNKLEESIISKQLHIANEESSSYTFQTGRGASNIDLTVMNNQAIDYVTDWKIHEKESCSDHKIIKYGIGKWKDLCQQTWSNKAGMRYRVTQRGTENFQRIFIQIMEQLLHGPNTVDAGIEEIDEALCQRV